MGRSYKNFWSLNVDEAVVTGIIRECCPKDVEVLMPLNAQMKDVDLILMNTENKKMLTIQVKGSKAYEPGKKEAEKYGDGSTGWFFLKKETVDESKAEYFIFLVYTIHQNRKDGRRTLEPHTITIPTKELQRLSRENKKPHPDRYSYYIWVNPEDKVAFDFRDKRYELNEYLDKKGFEKLLKNL